MILTKEEKERYSRQLMGNEFSKGKQKSLKKATVMVAGIGGLGGTVALYLASAGVGKLIIVHAGKLELPDMNRQILMSSQFVGQERVSIAANRLKEINPNVDIIPHSKWITKKNVHEMIAPADIVIDCRHNFEERSLLNSACIKQDKIMIEGAMDDMFGYITTISPGKTPCLSCVFPEYPSSWHHLGFAVIGVIPGTLGTLMALEAIKVITKTGEPLYSKLLTFNGMNMDFSKLKIRRSKKCKVCGQKK